MTGHVDTSIYGPGVPVAGIGPGPPPPPPPPTGGLPFGPWRACETVALLRRSGPAGWGLGPIIPTTLTTLRPRPNARTTWIPSPDLQSPDVDAAWRPGGDFRPGAPALRKQPRRRVGFVAAIDGRRVGILIAYRRAFLVIGDISETVTPGRWPNTARPVAPVL